MEKAKETNIKDLKSIIKTELLAFSSHINGLTKQ